MDSHHLNAQNNSASDDDNNQISFDPNTEVKTPLTVSIPTFGPVQELPTPMAYTPLSPRDYTLSPGPIHVKKRRANNAFLDPYDNVQDIPIQHRVVSELIAPPDISKQRIVSLPTVNEEASVLQNLRKIPDEFEDRDSDDIILNGYLLNDSTTLTQWHKIKQIGTGNFSDVKLYERADNTESSLKLIAVKRMRYPPDLTQGDTLSRLETSLVREIGVLQKLDHPCIVKLLGINDMTFLKNMRPLSTLVNKFGSNIPPCELIMSYCKGGDLLHALTLQNGNLELWLLKRIFSELVLAVKYLHSKNIIHRDLKLENVLLKRDLLELLNLGETGIPTDESIVELADFGLCKELEPDELCNVRCGSQDYVSPEILMGIPYNGYLSDSWALGVILYAILEDRLPFDPLPNANARQRSRATSHRIARFEWRWLKYSSIDLDAKDIVKNTLTRSNQRWSVDDIFNSSFIQDGIKHIKFSK